MQRQFSAAVQRYANHNYSQISCGHNIFFKNTKNPAASSSGSCICSFYLNKMNRSELRPMHTGFLYFQQLFAEYLRTVAILFFYNKELFLHLYISVFYSRAHFIIITICNKYSCCRQKTGCFDLIYVKSKQFLSDTDLFSL